MNRLGQAANHKLNQLLRALVVESLLRRTRFYEDPALIFSVFTLPIMYFLINGNYVTKEVKIACQFHSYFRYHGRKEK
jgi:hypothetical protein